MNSATPNHQHRTLVGLALLLLALMTVLATVRPVDARPAPQEVLEPSANAYILDFVNATERATWRAVSGTWSFQDAIYAQSDGAAVDAQTYYDKIIGDDFYWFEIDLATTGEQSGVLFNVKPNADNPESIDVAYVARFADQGQRVEWGYFRDGEFELQGSAANSLSITNFVTMRVAVQGNAYTVWVGAGEPLQLVSPPAVGFQPQPSPRIGLYTSRSQTVFQGGRIFVGPFENPTATPTSTATDTATPTSTNPPTNTPTLVPTATPLPTNTPTPDPTRYFEPNTTTPLLNTPIDLNSGAWIQVTGTGRWEAVANEYMRHPSTDNADDILLQNRRANGDYTLVANMQIETLGSTPAGGGLVFNAGATNARNGAYVVVFDGTDLVRWGYFQADSFVSQGEQRINRDAFNLNNLTFVPLKVIVNSNLYTIQLNNINVTSPIPFSVSAVRLAQPLIGLYASRADARFQAGSMSIAVTGFSTPTATPTATMTGTPPTPTPTGTEEPTPATGQYEPSNDTYIIDNSTPGDIGVNWVQAAGGGWVIQPASGLWQEEVTFRDNILLQSRRVNGDYKLRADVRINDFDVTVAHGAGLTFYAPAATGRNGAYIVAFDGSKLRWGHFENDTLRLKNEVILDPTAYEIVAGEPVGLRVDVFSDQYSIFVNEREVTAAKGVRFESAYPRSNTANYFGLYANLIDALYPAGTTTLNVSQRTVATATPTPITPTLTATNTPVTPGATSTPLPTATRPTATPTWTWTPTFTPWPTSPLPTPTGTPTPFGQGTAIITTPSGFDSPLDANAAAFATQTTMAQEMTMTAQVTPTPTWTFVPQGDSPLPTPAEVPVTETPTPEATEPAVAVIVVTPEPDATQRPIITPTPTATLNAAMLTARIIDSAVAAAGWIWFGLGSLLFFTVAGILAGLSFRQQEHRRYDLVEEPQEDDPTRFAGSSLPDIDNLPPVTPPPAPPDDWPSSLP